MDATAAGRPALDGLDAPGARWRARRRGCGDCATFALVYPQEDRKLTPPDVQKIAEAFLLWRGNHSWKVVDVAPAADGAHRLRAGHPGGLGDRPLHHGPAQRPGDPHRLIAYDGGRDVPHPPAAARAALDRLIASDPDLAGIEARAGRFALAHPCARLSRACCRRSSRSRSATRRRRRSGAGCAPSAARWSRPGCWPCPTMRCALPACRGRRSRMPASLAAAFLDGTLDADAIAAMDDEAAVATIARGARPGALDRGGLPAVRARPARRVPCRRHRPRGIGGAPQGTGRETGPGRAARHGRGLAAVPRARGAAAVAPLAPRHRPTDDR